MTSEIDGRLPRKRSKESTNRRSPGGNDANFIHKCEGGISNRSHHDNGVCRFS